MKISTGSTRIWQGIYLVRSVVASILSLTWVILGVFPIQAHAPGQDPCPEPNDEFQQACFLGAGAEANAFLSTSDDVDAYRIVALDFNSTAHIELLNSPGDYKFVVGDWNGRSIATSEHRENVEFADVSLPMPGSYYIFVQSPGGNYDENVSYRLVPRIDYSSAVIPQAKYSTDFGGQLPGLVTDFSIQPNTARDISLEGGRYRISNRPQPGRPFSAVQVLETNRLTDFTMTVDARVVTPAEAGIVLVFRVQAPMNMFRLDVSYPSRRVVLAHMQGAREIAAATAENLDVKGGVNRFSVKAVRDSFVININGTEVIAAKETSYSAGQLGLGATTLTEPAVVQFDNLLVTVPGWQPGSVTTSGKMSPDDLVTALLNAPFPESDVPNGFSLNGPFASDLQSDERRLGVLARVVTLFKGQDGDSLLWHVVYSDADPARKRFDAGLKDFIPPGFDVPVHCSIASVKLSNGEGYGRTSCEAVVENVSILGSSSVNGNRPRGNDDNAISMLRTGLKRLKTLLEGRALSRMILLNHDLPQLADATQGS